VQNLCTSKERRHLNEPRLQLASHRAKLWYQAFDDTTDEIVDLFDRCLATAYARAGRELEEFRRTMARSTNEKVLLFRELGRLVLDATVTDDQLRAQIYRKVSHDDLLAAVAEADRIGRTTDDNYRDLLAQRYSVWGGKTSVVLRRHVRRHGGAHSAPNANGSGRSRGRHYSRLSIAEPFP